MHSGVFLKKRNLWYVQAEQKQEEKPLGVREKKKLKKKERQAADKVEGA